MRVGIVALAASALLTASCVAAGAVGPPVGEPPPPVLAGVTPDGQWVQTQQYGWLWMPYGDAYTYVPPDGIGEPLEYVYYPSSGWSWIAAPWVWGVGPMPGFGRRDPDRFAWYEHGWWRDPDRWRYRPAPEPEGHAGLGVRPAPPDRGERRFGEEHPGRPPFVERPLGGEHPGEQPFAETRSFTGERPFAREHPFTGEHLFAHARPFAGEHPFAPARPLAREHPMVQGRTGGAFGRTPPRPERDLPGGGDRGRGEDERR